MECWSVDSSGREVPSSVVVEVGSTGGGCEGGECGSGSVIGDGGGGEPVGVVSVDSPGVPTIGVLVSGVDITGVALGDPGDGASEVGGCCESVGVEVFVGESGLVTTGSLGDPGCGGVSIVLISGVDGSGGF